MRSSLLLLSASLCILTLAGCWTSGIDGVSITQVTPQGVIGHVGDTVTFTVHTTGDFVRDSWNFAPGSVDFLGGIAPEVDVRLNQAGTFEGVVRIDFIDDADAPGTYTSQQFEYIVIPAGVPIISGVTPLIGEPGATVTMQATASDSPTAWQWSFEGFGVPGTSTEATPSVRLTAVPGTYSGSVIASTAAGSSGAFPFTFTVAVGAPTVPSVTSVSPSGIAGASGASVQFVPNAQGAPDNWQWDFGGGATPNTSEEERPQVTLGAAGTYHGQLIATNPTGPSAAFPFTYVVTSSSPGIYTTGDVSDFFNNTDTDFPLSATVIDGLPAVAFDHYEPGEEGIYFARANTETPSGDADWNRHIIEALLPGTLNGAHVYLTSRNNRPAVIYQMAAGVTRVAIANTINPLTASDWSITDGPTITLSNGGSHQLISLSNRLAFAQPTGAGFDLWIANVALPTGPADWTAHTFVSDPSTIGELIVRPNGTPALSFVNSSTFPSIAATDQTLPDATSDWQTHQITDVPATGYSASTALAAHGDKLAVAFNNFESDEFVQYVAVSSSGTPSTLTDWSVTRVDPLHGGPASLVSFNGRLSVVYSGDTDGSSHPLMIARATADVPTSTSDWSVRQLNLLVFATQGVLLATPGNQGVLFADTFNGEIQYAFSPNP